MGSTSAERFLGSPLPGSQRIGVRSRHPDWNRVRVVRCLESVIATTPMGPSHRVDNASADGSPTRPHRFRG